MDARNVVMAAVAAVLLGAVLYLGLRLQRMDDAPVPVAPAPAEERSNRERIEDAATDRAVDELLNRGGAVAGWR